MKRFVINCRHLSDQVTSKSFFEMLKKYIHDLYHGRLIHSTEFLSLFFHSFSKKRDSYRKIQERVGEVCSTWLDTPTIPNELVEKYARVDFSSHLSTVISYWTRFNSRKRPFRAAPSLNLCLTSEQLLVLLEKLLGLEGINMSAAKLNAMDKVYEFDRENPEVQHRWCELIIKHAYVERVNFVVNFLTQHQSMGVYLYGELASSECKKFNRAATDVFKCLSTEMDPNMVTNVSNLIGSITKQRI